MDWVALEWKLWGLDRGRLTDSYDALLKEGYLRRHYCTVSTGGLHEYISIDDEFSDKNNRSKYNVYLGFCKRCGDEPVYKDIEEWLDSRYDTYLKTLMRYRELNNV